ncbi:hypothetical protein B5X24_HaOG203825 [Helicoverpa armigera]|nr:hypothetical protein B5X24_HaOG203825 [Helicoverpa armigera]
MGHPLLNIGLPLRSPQIPVGGDLHPASCSDLYKVVCPPCWWTSYAALASPWSPLQHFSTPSAICSASNMACPSPLQLHYNSVSTSQSDQTVGRLKSLQCVEH